MAASTDLNHMIRTLASHLSEVRSSIEALRFDQLDQWPEFVRKYSVIASLMRVACADNVPFLRSFSVHPGALSSGSNSTGPNSGGEGGTRSGGDSGGGGGGGDLPAAEAFLPRYLETDVIPQVRLEDEEAKTRVLAFLTEIGYSEATAPDVMNALAQDIQKSADNYSGVLEYYADMRGLGVAHHMPPAETSAFPSNEEVFLIRESLTGRPVEFSILVPEVTDVIILELGHSEARAYCQMRLNEILRFLKHTNWKGAIQSDMANWKRSWRTIANS
eukprot:ANDGO_05211.mRNA.1 hypothetical protein